MKSEILAVTLAAMLAACGEGKRPMVAATASAIMGPSTARPSLFTGDDRPPAAPLIEGNYWKLSPDKASLTLTGIDFIADGKMTSTDLSTCSGLYDRTRRSGEELFQCPIEVPIGKITSLTIRVGTSIDVLIHDPSHGIYTDPSKPGGFATTPPSEGARFATLTVPNTRNNKQNEYPIQVFLTSPLAVTADSTPDLYLVVDLVHSLWAKATNGALALTHEAGVFPPAQIFASFSRPGRSEFYTATNTAENVSTETWLTEWYVRMNYVSSDEAGHVWTGDIPNCMFGNFANEAWNISPDVAPDGGSGMKAGGYLGLDATNHLAWALSTDFTWLDYRGLFMMKRAAAIGNAVDLTCEFASTVPAPADGNTYASGAPSISIRTTSLSLKLVAN